MERFDPAAKQRDIAIHAKIPREMDASAEFVKASWRRSQLAGVTQTSHDVPYLGEIEENRLLHCSSKIMERLAESLKNMGVSVAISDHKARVLRRIDTDSEVAKALDRVSLTPGFDYAEGAIGTNGIGTVIASGRSAHIMGNNHYQEQFARFTCSGSPIRDPLTGRIEGVLDLSAIVQDSCVYMHSLVRASAKEIEQALLMERSILQRAVFEQYVLTDIRSRHSVFAVGARIGMVNDKAQQEFSAEEQQAIRSHCILLLEQQRDIQVIIELPTGVEVALRCELVRVAESATGLIAEVSTITRPDAPRSVDIESAYLPTPGNPHHDGQQISALVAPLSTITSKVPEMRRACLKISELQRTCVAFIVTGEPGTGKITAVDELYRALNPRGRVVIIEPEDLQIGYPSHGQKSMQAFGENTLIVFRNIHLLKKNAAQRLREILRSKRKNGVAMVATIAPRSETEPYAEHVQQVIQRFDQAVKIPALRHRIADLPDIVQCFLGNRALGRKREFSLRAMRTLESFDWPGNLYQLEEAIEYALGQRITGVVQPEDLPPYCFTQARRKLNSIESAERDAIVTELQTADGNRTQAARNLGISRSSLYRKIERFNIQNV